jgi:hypothetical protein
VWTTEPVCTVCEVNWLAAPGKEVVISRPCSPKTGAIFTGAASRKSIIKSCKCGALFRTRLAIFHGKDFAKYINGERNESVISCMREYNSEIVSTTDICSFYCPTDLSN